MSLLVPLPVLLPLVAAGLCLTLAGHPVLQRITSLTALTGVMVSAAALLYLADRGGPIAVRLGGWEAQFGIVMVADRLSALFLLVSSIITVAVMVYGIGQGLSAGDDETPVTVFHPSYLILSAGVSNTFLAGDLFNMFVGFEMLLVASYVLLTVGATEARVRAGMTYVVVSVVSSFIFLIGIGLAYAATGTLNLAHLATRLPELPSGTGLAIHLVLLVAFGIKAAMFPLGGWLPDSYPTASAPVTAVFAGLLTKVGVYSIIRTQTLLFPGDRLTTPLLVIAALTMLLGILGAIAQSDVKRMLSFTLVSHIGYMIFGIALGGAAGLAATIFYAAHHITVQATLFQAVGLMERQGGGTSDLDRLGGVALLSPLVGVLFFVPAMSLSGIPPLSGFFGKVGLFEAGVSAGGWLPLTVVGIGALTGLLTLYAVVRTWARAFWSEPTAAARRQAQQGVDVLPSAMVGSTVALVVCGLAITVVAGPLFSFADRAAAGALAHDTYIGAVFPVGAP